MQRAILGIGGNTGNKQANFQKVYKEIQNELGQIVLFSSVYQSPPWGFESKDDFWNQVVVVETTWSPQDLLQKIHLIEATFGRKKTAGGYHSRDMDIDILFYDQLVIQYEDLVIPHPLIHKRMFVLVPLAEVLPDMIHPVLKKSITELRNNCNDKSLIIKI